ncbi:MAG TPA: organomercurial lyase [Methylomirabilota bacterium]|nr:organomercurial lyase [Methylomirabilota bacterium]
MSASFPVRSAADLMDATFLAKWTDRAALSAVARAALREILDRLVTDGRPIDVSTLAAGVTAVDELDVRDLVYVSGGRVVLAYPWSGTPTAFVTVLADGRERWACCAIDALGVAAMLGQTVIVRAGCHHCDERLELPVTPQGPVAGSGVMAWIGERGDLRGKACTAL